VETENYTNGRSINIAGVDYAITAVNGGARTITVSGSPAAGSQTVLFFPHRIAGSTTTARLFRTSARAIVSGGDAAGTILPGLRRRDYSQAWQLGGSKDKNYFSFLIADNQMEDSGGSANVGLQRMTTTAQGHANAVGPKNDGTHNNIRNGFNNEPRSLGAYIYIWGGRYVA
jgi:hypothetical protein